MKTPKLPLRVDAYWPPPKVVDADNESLELEEVCIVANSEARRADGLEIELKNTIGLWNEALRDRDHFRKQALKAIGSGLADARAKEELEKWKGEQQQALIKQASILLTAGYRGDGVTDGLKWLAEQLAMWRKFHGDEERRAANLQDDWHTALAQIEHLQELLTEARALIIERGESMDVPLQFRQHGWLTRVNAVLESTTEAKSDATTV